MYRVWKEILEDARWYPSPHNSQPIKAHLLGPSEAAFFYDKACGLPAEDYGIAFGYVCMGVFLEGLRVAAGARGYDLDIDLIVSEMDFSSVEKMHKFADIKLIKNSKIDMGQAKKDLTTFLNRRTSRRPYLNKLVPKGVLKNAAKVAEGFNQTFSVSSDQNLVDKIIDINQRTLFDDLRRDAVYDELMEWLRFSDAEAEKKADGLSARTLLIPGRILRFAFRHRGLWNAPVIGRFFQWVYLRTMKGVRQVGWLEGEFTKPVDCIRAGKCFMRLWLYFTAENIYLHPYGTVITNPNSHNKFTRLVDAKESGSKMAWMLFRFGYSDQPPRSHRRKLKSMIMEEL